MKVEGEGPEGEGGGEDVGLGEGALGEPDGVDGGEEGGGEGGGCVEEALGEAEDGEEGGGGDGGDEEARGEDVVADDVPEGAEEDVGDGRVGVGVVRDDLAVAVEVEGRGDVVAALVPVVGEMEEGEVAEGHGGEEQDEEDGRGESGDAC